MVILLIILGFALNKTGLSAAGAILIFLPVFGHFAVTMFFLGGLGFLRLLWMPLLDVSFNVMRLGEIVVLPYRWFSTLYNLTGLQKWLPAYSLITGTGLLLFFLGTWTWFTTYYKKKGVAEHWVYRICRHPQYLGWIIWSYGIMFIPAAGSMKRYWSISNTLPWLLATIVIIAVAFMEELKLFIHKMCFYTDMSHQNLIFQFLRLQGFDVLVDEITFFHV